MSPHTSRTRQVLLATLAVVTAFVLTACGGKVNTLLTVNEGNDPGGSRVMTVTIADTSGSQDRVHGGMDAVDRSIRDHLPPELEYSGVSQVGQEATITFTLNFDNLEDYRTKAQALLDAGNKKIDARISYSNTQDKLVNGIMYSENFNSLDLLNWLPDALFDDGVIEKSDIPNVLSAGTNTYVIAGKTFEEKYGNPRVADVVNNGVAHVTVNVAFKDDGSYGLTVTFNDRDRINKPRQEELKGWLTDHSPEGTEIKELTDNGVVVGATATYSAQSLDEISAALQQILDQPKAEVSQQTPSSEHGALQARKQITINAPCEGICSPTSSFGPAINVAVSAPQSWHPEEPSTYTTDSANTLSIDGPEGVFVFSKPVTVVNPTLTTSIGLDRSVTQSLDVVITDELDESMTESVKAALSPDQIFGDVAVSDYDKDGVKGKKFTVTAHARSATAFNTLLRKAYGSSTFAMSIDDGWPEDTYLLTTDSTMLNRVLSTSVQGAVHDYLDLPFSNSVDKDAFRYGLVSEKNGKLELGSYSDPTDFHHDLMIQVSGPSQSDLIIDAVVLGLLLIAAGVGGFFFRRYALRRKEAGLPLFGQPAQTVLVPAGAMGPQAQSPDPLIHQPGPVMASAPSAPTGAFPQPTHEPSMPSAPITAEGMADSESQALGLTDMPPGVDPAQAADPAMSHQAGAAAAEVEGVTSENFTEGFLL